MQGAHMPHPWYEGQVQGCKERGPGPTADTHMVQYGRCM